MVVLANGWLSGCWSVDQVSSEREKTSMPSKLTSTETITTFKLKMSTPVAEYMKGKPVVALSIPLVFGQGTKLFFVEFCGAPTGRASLCTVIGTDGKNTILERRWCWSQGKMDDDLAFLGLTISEGEFTILGKSAIPEEKSK